MLEDSFRVKDVLRNGTSSIKTVFPDKSAQFLCRCSASFDVSMAKKYYKIGGIKLEQILLRHSKRDDEENLVRSLYF